MTDEKSIGDVVVEWYGSALGRDDGGARAARARLRRCHSPVEALAIAETHELHKRLRENGARPTADQLALLATTFARLKGIHGARLAALFGKRESKDGPRPLSELRFQSLIRVRARSELIAPLRRSLGVLGSDPACNGRALAEDFYFWNERVRNTWCFQYFGTALAAENQEETAQ
ncbi:MAG: type I-E CRISPR-associated protein Cse2/CasB [Rhodospirillaceae bacterium]|nr:type I-E CRISPR-associated protein Cse2/CasB [Rhodospirillaceae bacterium]